LFTGFPPAYAAVATALNVPLTVMLVCLVLRGSAFAFQTHEAREDAARSAWARVFGVASVLTPLLLGVTLGAIASGRIRVDDGGRILCGFFETWLAPFPIGVGVFTTALFA